MSRKVWMPYPLRSPHRRALAIMLAAGLLGVGGMGWLFQESERARIGSPDGRFVAIVSCRNHVALRPSLPGHSGDKAGSIRIEDAGGRDYGRIPVWSVREVENLRWTEQGATLPLIGEWDFQKRECRHWNAEQTREIVRRAR